MENQPKIGEFCWNELATADVAAAKDFYGKVFGWKFTEHKMGDMTYTMIKIKDQEFGGIWAIPENQKMPPHWLSYILVDNIEQTVENARKNGAHIIRPVTPAGDMGRLAIFTDPTGAHIALWEPTKR